MTGRDVALVTPSYHGDLQRCRLLCDTMDAHVGGLTRHVILVEDADEPLFRPLAGPRREVVREGDLLPSAFRTVTLRRRMWLARGLPPLRGWHMQQLRRIAVARHLDEAALLYCDSDMAFVRSFDVARLWQGEALRLYRVEDGIHDGLPGGGAEHREWTAHAYALLGLEPPTFPAPDHINNLVSWRRDHVLDMMGRIESVTGRPWWRAVAARRRFSECQIYGAHATLTHLEGHWATPRPLCRTQWGGAAMGAEALRSFVEEMDEDQVAVGIQSFTNTDPDDLRRVLLS